MRILHLADLHFGKIVAGYSMQENLDYALQQVLEIIDQEAVDVVLMSGDIYDRKIVSKDAVLSYNDFLNALIIDRDLKVLSISGNHDPRERLEASNVLLERAGYYIEGLYKSKIRRVRIEDEYGPVDFFLLPFFDVSEAQLVDEKNYRNFDEAYQGIIESLHTDPKVRSVLLAHGYFVTDDRFSEEKIDSEKPLSIGGKEYVYAAHFSKFDYVAAGHLHRRQNIGLNIHYPGTLVKYSFSEAGHSKSVSIVDLNGQGDIEITWQAIKQKYDFRKITGSFDQIMQQAPMDQKRDDFILFELDDLEIMPDAMNRLKTYYPHAMQVTYSEQRQKNALDLSLKGRETLTMKELLQHFYFEKMGEAVPEELMEIIDPWMEEVQ